MREVKFLQLTKLFVVEVVAIHTFSYICALPKENTIRFIHI